MFPRVCFKLQIIYSATPIPCIFQIPSHNNHVFIYQLVTISACVNIFIALYYEICVSLVIKKIIMPQNTSNLWNRKTILESRHRRDKGLREAGVTRGWQGNDMLGTHTVVRVHTAQRPWAAVTGRLVLQWILQFSRLCWITAGESAAFALEQQLSLNVGPGIYRHQIRLTF